jgi:hypothetical protein
MCFGGSGAIGWLLGLALSGRPVLAALTLGLVVVGAALLLWKWSESERKADIRRWFEYRWWRLKRLPWTILAVLVGMAVVSSAVGFWGSEEGWKGLWQNLGPELGGAVVTYVLLDLVLGTRNRKQALINQMGSPVNAVAVPAVDDLRREGWLEDGSLRGVSLWHAALQGAHLQCASLEDAQLIETHLERAVLIGAHLERAVLWKAHLEGADLRFAHLEGAVLWEAHLEGAVLTSTSLEGANVTVKQLAEARTLEYATLPEGTELSGDNWKAEFEEWRQKQEAEAERDHEERDDRDGDDDD